MKRPDFGRYQVVEEIGRGAMGVVYRATDPVMGRTVAIKAIARSFLDGVGVKASEYFERFRREAEVAGRLSHPNIVKIFDLGPEYLVMEFIEGDSLASVLEGKRRPAPEQILRIVSEVADALDYAHGHGIVHRDIKPANIMIERDGTAKVMDFGLARVESSTLTTAGEILGSASYMAPEVILGRPASDRSDIFALGVVAYEMVTGQRPFSGSSISIIIHRIVSESPPAACGLNLYLPPEYDQAFERVLAKDPAARHPTASAFATELNLRRWAEPGEEQEAVPQRGAEGERTADAGSPTLLVAETQETGLPDLGLVATPERGLPAGSREPPEEEEAPLAGLVGEPAPADEAPAGAAPPPAVPAAVPEAPAGPSPPHVRPPSGGVPLAAILAGAILVLVILAGSAAFLVYRLLARRGPGPEAAAPSASAQIGQSAPAETPPPSEPPPASPEPLPPEQATPATPAPPALATLRVASEPAGARVTVGKRERGVTPLELKLPAGKVSLSVRKDGFQPWSRDVELPARGLDVVAQLEALPRPSAAPTSTPAPRGVQTGDLVPLGAGVTPPRRISGGAPSVPREAARAHLTGSVLLEFVVDEDGRVTDAKVVQSAGEAIDAACLAAIATWRYEPATTQGVRVKVVQRARFTFESQ